MYNVKSLKAEEFISDEEILDTLAYADANKDNVALIDEILNKLELENKEIVSINTEQLYKRKNIDVLKISDLRF